MWHCVISGVDISRPLKNSFIHTGHGDVLGENSWGNIAAIDEWVCLSIHLYVRSSVRSSIHLSCLNLYQPWPVGGYWLEISLVPLPVVCQCVYCVCVCQSICLPVCLSVCLSTCLCVCQSIHLPVCVSLLSESVPALACGRLTLSRLNCATARWQVAWHGWWRGVDPPIRLRDTLAKGCWVTGGASDGGGQFIIRLFVIVGGVC